MNVNEGTIRHLQEYVAHKIEKRGFKDETLHERLLLLTEEVGELAKACRKISGMHCDNNREITTRVGEEIADVINMIFSVGIELGLDIESEYRKKEDIIDTRTYKRTNKDFAA